MTLSNGQVDGASEQEGGEARHLQASDIERLYRTVGSKLLQYIRRQVPQPSVAADLLQEVFVRLMRTKVIEKSEGEVRSYLYRIATSVVAEHYRVARLAQSVSVVGDESAAEVTGDVQDVPLGAPEVGQALSQLPVNDRALLWLAYVEEMSHAEVGSVMGLATASVKVLLFRARKRLAKALRATGYAPGGGA